jgi:RimJ/RimL family protein N-acetyltransferase
MNVITTERLTLTPITAAIAEALAAKDRTLIEAVLDLQVADPFELPPLLDEDIAHFARGLAAAPEDAGWWGWLIGYRQRLCGFVMCAKPDAHRISMLGWSVYPSASGHGIATEAMRAIVGWSSATGNVGTFRATVPADLPASLRVASRLGLRQVDEIELDGRRVFILECAATVDGNSEAPVTA